LQSRLLVHSPSQALQFDLPVHPCIVVASFVDSFSLPQAGTFSSNRDTGLMASDQIQGFVLAGNRKLVSVAHDCCRYIEEELFHVSTKTSNKAVVNVN
jgi:hypothetical protein